MKPENKNVRRLSVVCWLNIWKITKNIDKSILKKHDNIVRQLGKHPER